MKTQGNVKPAAKKSVSTSLPKASVSLSTQTLAPTGPPVQTPTASAGDTSSYPGNLTKAQLRALKEAEARRLKALSERYKCMDKLDALNKEIPRLERIIATLRGEVDQVQALAQASLNMAKAELESFGGPVLTNIRVPHEVDPVTQKAMDYVKPKTTTAPAGNIDLEEGKWE